jgi:UDP-glucose 4-epimerase
MEARRVLVTGGAGMIGSAIVDQLLHHDVDQIVVIDNLVRGRRANLGGALESGRVALIERDICDRPALSEVMDGVDVVFHQAALRITQCAVEPRLAMEVLIDGTFNVLEAAVAAGVRRIVAASSASAYGLATVFPTPEVHHPYANRTLYGAAKAFNEGLLRSFNEMYGIEYVALRYFNVYGPRMDVHGAYTEALIRWLQRIDAGQPPLIFGDGSQTMDFVYVDDVARANVLAAEKTVSDEVFNVGSGNETSLKELAMAVLTAMDSDLRPEHTAERAVNPVPRRLADTTQARDLLGFEAEVSLDEGLRRLVEWWRSQADGRGSGAGT